MLDWLFTPVHSVIKMTPLTCVTAGLCAFLPAYLPWVTDNFTNGILIALGLALVIATLNLGIHELYAKSKKRKQ